MTRWIDIFLWLWISSLLISMLCLCLVGIRKVGLFNDDWIGRRHQAILRWLLSLFGKRMPDVLAIKPGGWMEEFDQGDRQILKVAGCILLAGFVSLGIYAVLYIF